MKYEYTGDSVKEQEDLKLRTKKFALRVIKLVRSLPKNMVAYEIGRQLLRSGTSVASNTRAAFRGRSKKEFLAKIGIVIEEADSPCEITTSHGFE